nr:hypothetical protein Iba_chr10bCG10120 [Ipomoea batatas]
MANVNASAGVNDGCKFPEHSSVFFQVEELPSMPLSPSIATLSLAAMYVQTASTAQLSHEGGGVGQSIIDTPLCLAVPPPDPPITPWALDLSSPNTKSSLVSSPRFGECVQFL